MYDILITQIKRLKGDIPEEELKEIFKEYIYDRLTDQQVLEIIKTDTVSSIDLPDGLKKEAVLRITAKMVGDLINSNTWQGFEQQNKQPPKQSIEFDNLIQRILTRKPPE